MADREIKGQHHPPKSFLKSSLSLYFFVPSCLSGQDPRSTLVETPLQIHLFSAKQSQCQNGQYKHKYSKNKGLCQRTTNNEQRTSSKTNPIHHGEAGFHPCPNRHTYPNSAPRFPSAKSFLRLRNTRYAIRNTKFDPFPFTLPAAAAGRPAPGLPA
jgi:hypothetical protein